MNYEDLMLYHQAEQLARSGQMQSAYTLFRQLRGKSVLPDVNILVGIAYTTVDAVEAEGAIASIRTLQPDHPQLASLEAMHRRRLQKPIIMSMMPIGPVLRCPYCGYQGPALVRSKMSTAGVVVLVLLLIFTVIFFWIGLLITEKYYACARCGSKITTAIWS